MTKDCGKCYQEYQRGFANGVKFIEHALENNKVVLRYKE